jgi:menaquinone-9 beta-reductase
MVTPICSTGDDGVLLVGDAAGLACPHSGEGIRPAVESGLMAAATVLEAGADYRRQRLAGYRDRLLARYGSANADTGGTGSEALRSVVARVLLRSRWFARHVVLDRWFLQTHQAEFQVN